MHYSWKTCIRFTQMPRALVFRGKAEWYGLLGKVFPFLWECCRCVYWRSRWLLGMSHPRCFCGVYETSILSVYSVCNCGVSFVRPSPRLRIACCFNIAVPVLPCPRLPLGRLGPSLFFSLPSEVCSQRDVLLSTGQKGLLSFIGCLLGPSI